MNELRTALIVIQARPLAWSRTIPATKQRLYFMLGLRVFASVRRSCQASDEVRTHFRRVNAELKQFHYHSSEVDPSLGCGPSVAISDALDRRVLERLAESYPSPREKEEVPVWFYLASQISLRLHGAPGLECSP